jgi:hypothetical protein
MAIQLDIKTIIIVVLLLLLVGGGFYHFNQIGKHKAQHALDEKLQRALTDTVHHYKNEKGQWVAERLTLQLDIKDLKDKNLTLTQAQKDLLDAVKKVNKQNQVITAALIDMGVKLDGLANEKPVVTDSTVQFIADSDTISYDIVIRDVKALDSKTPKLQFKKFSLPNKQFIEFHWKDNRKEGYPISFSVTNSNPYYKVYDINSYAIEELNKATVKPNFWQRMGKFGKSTGGKLILLGVGFVAGAAIVN